MHEHLRLPLVLLIAALTVLLTSCGDDGGAATPTAGAETTGAETTSDGTTGDVTGPEDLETAPVTEAALETCLSDADLEPEDDNDAVALLVEDPYRKIRVELDPEGETSSDLVAELYVFESGEQAEANRTAITLQTEDTERHRVIENVVLNYTIIPSYDPDGAEAVEGCLDEASAS